VNEDRHFPGAQVDIGTVRAHAASPFAGQKGERHLRRQFPAAIERAQMVHCYKDRIISTKRPERERAEHQSAQLAQRFVPLDELVEFVTAIRVDDRSGCRHAGDQSVPAEGGCDRRCKIGFARTSGQKRLAELEMLKRHPIKNLGLF